MIVRRFLEWSQTANASGRAEAASSLARAWLYADLDIDQQAEALAALTLLLDDPAPIVRGALSEALASAAEAPGHIVVALAHDQSEVAAPVLARSPVLCDSDLVDCVAVGDAGAHIAVAGRADLSAAVCGALAEIAGAPALIALTLNRSAQIPEISWRRMIERHGSDADLREAILARRDLPASIRHMLVVAAADALSSFVRACDWMQPERGRRVVAEACEAAAVTIANDSGDCDSLARHLCDSGQLTAGLLLRALLSGHAALVEAALAELTGQPVRRVAAIMTERRGAGFAALYRKAGLPQSLFAAFSAALAAWRDLSGEGGDQPAALSRRLIERTLSALERDPAAEDAKLFALLRRFEAEAAREDARAFVAGMMGPSLDELEADIRRLVEERTALAA